MSNVPSIDIMLATCRQWFAGLPEGLAEMQESRPNSFEVALDVRPCRSPQAAAFTLRLGCDGTFDVAAGAGAQFDELSPTEYDIAAICDSLVKGGLVEDLERNRDGLIASRARLQVGSATLHSHREQLDRRLRSVLLGGQERATVHYAPYDPDLTSRHEKVPL
jgi:hypothetical protein